MEPERTLLGRVADARQDQRQWLDDVARRLVQRGLHQLSQGRLRIIENGQVSEFGQGGEVVVVVRES